MTPQQIMNGMHEKNRQLSMKNDELLVLSEKMAAGERDYKIAYAKKALELRSDGFPATLINQLCLGDKTVAGLRYERDVAEGVYNACRESIRALHRAIDTYRSLLAWQKAEFQSQ